MQYVRRHLCDTSDGGGVTVLRRNARILPARSNWNRAQEHHHNIESQRGGYATDKLASSMQVKKRSVIRLVRKVVGLSLGGIAVVAALGAASLFWLPSYWPTLIGIEAPSSDKIW